MKCTGPSWPSPAVRSALAAITFTSMSVAPLCQALAQSLQGRGTGATRSPVQHIILIIGENRSFDHVFATYKPRSGETINNLLSERIINANGFPGPNFAQAARNQASDRTTYQLNPGSQSRYSVLPPAMTDGAPSAASDENPPPFATLTAATQVENQTDDGLPVRDYKLLTTGATGLPADSADTRVPNAITLPNGPYQLSKGMPYDSYTSSPAHRFRQMRQQTSCSASQITPANPSRCTNKLFPWVEVTIGAGSNGSPQPASFTNQTTGEGSTSMGFYNMEQGDVPRFKYLADTCTISDNFHQAIMGGTGANHVAIGTGLAI